MKTISRKAEIRLPFLTYTVPPTVAAHFTKEIKHYDNKTAERRKQTDKAT